MADTVLCPPFFMFGVVHLLMVCSFADIICQSVADGDWCVRIQ